MVKLKEAIGPREFHRDEVWRADLSGSEGHEQKKDRRVLIVQNDIANQYSSVITIVTMTSYKGGKIYPHEVLIKKPEGGTTRDSIIQASQIRTLDKELRFIEYCGKVSGKTMVKVEEALKIHLGITKL